MDLLFEIEEHRNLDGEREQFHALELMSVVQFKAEALAAVQDRIKSGNTRDAMVTDDGAADDCRKFLGLLALRHAKESPARKRNGQEELSSHH
jgi:hypothetical protein